MFSVFYGKNVLEYLFDVRMICECYESSQLFVTLFIAYTPFWFVQI